MCTWCIGSSTNRCHAFSNCHERLTEYSKSLEAWNKSELKPIEINQEPSHLLVKKIKSPKN